jgi:modular serine protease
MRELPRTGIEPFPLDSFDIIAGKYYRDFDAQESSIQSFKPVKIKTHDTYYGFSGNFDADIAIITLDNRIIYEPHIAPVCLDLNLKSILEKQAPSAGSVGVVAGYGYTLSDGAPSEYLKKIKLPVIDTKQCKNEAPENYKKFITSDKFCAGKQAILNS